MSVQQQQQPLIPPPPPVVFMNQQAQTGSSGTHGSVGPVIGVLAVIAVLGVLAGMVGRLCSGRSFMGYGHFDVEGWIETKCSACLDGHVPRPRSVAVPLQVPVVMTPVPAPPVVARMEELRLPRAAAAGESSGTDPAVVVSAGNGGTIQQPVSRGTVPPGAVEAEKQRADDDDDDYDEDECECDCECDGNGGGETSDTDEDGDGKRQNSHA